MNFAQAAKAQGNFKRTENGATAMRSTGSELVNLFATIGAMRPRQEYEIIDAFERAFAEDNLLALKMVFYARNIRGGLGERRTGRVILRHLAKTRPDLIRKNMAAVPLFGRYDDLYEFVGTGVEEAMWGFMRQQMMEDIKGMADGQPISLLAKWMKSVNASSADSRRLGKMTAQKLGMTERLYRKTLSRMRNYLRVVEQKMSANEWGTIVYEEIPSNAMKKYRKAWARHDVSGNFETFMQKVERGEAKIHADTLYPYDLVGQYLTGAGRSWGSRADNCYGDAQTVATPDRVVEAQWKALPNYVNDEYNVLAMCDVSGSMTSSGGRPMATSVGLGIYFAERNQGPMHNLYMTFTDDPHFITVRDGSLLSKVQQVCAAGVGYSTDMERAFRAVLDMGVRNRIAPEDMPRAIVVISDMEINKYQHESYWTFIAAMEREFNRAGYELPNIILWNVESRQDTFHASAFNRKVQYASGQGVSVFKDILRNMGKTAWDAMVETLSNPMYDCITL